MDFVFSEEQEMLRQQVRSFFTDKLSTERVAELATSDEGWEEGSFAAMAELGWTGLSIPEEFGGAGMGFLDEAVVFEEMGRALYAGPYFSTIGLALPAVLAAHELAGAVAAGEATATLAWAEPSGPTRFMDLASVSTKADKTDGTWALSGEKHLVPDASLVGTFVVVAKSADGVGLWSVDASEAEVAPASTMDATRRLGTVGFSGARATSLIEPGEGLEILERIRLRAAAALSLEAVGVAQRVLEMSIDHATERKQFDKPIGTYQAVSHQVVDSFVETELARSLAYWAAWCVDTSDDQAPIAVAAAKASAGRAAVTACERAIQVHGGIGFTWEHPLHLFYKRAHWINAFDGGAAPQRAVIAKHLLD